MIKGYWHVLLHHHYFSVVTDQMRILLTSGLYDACEEIQIGCLGTMAERLFLEEHLIALYPKLKLKYYSLDYGEYEFPTLALIQADTDDFTCFYFHTKGVTKPFDSESARWRSWLNEAVINRWKQHYEKIQEGNDVSSIAYKECPDHFSGNFWWSHKGYIDKLPPIAKMLWNSRYSAEQWVVRGYHGKFYDIATDKTQDFHYINYKQDD